MSFTFNWPRFSDQFHYDAIQMLNNALNKGNKPPIIADRIEVVELEMGTQPPELEIRDIGDLTVDQFRGIFRLTYSGDAHIVLKTKVQANPLNHKQPDIHLMTGSRGMLAAKEPLVVPMHLRLSNFKLNSYVVLVVSKQKGITLVFKTDPLQNVDINSTFDSIAVIQKFIQREIEGQLRQMFREDLPGIIHRLSQQWVKAKVEAPYLQKQPSPTVTRQHPTDSDAMSDVASAVHSLPPTPLAHDMPPYLARRAQSLASVPRRPRSVSGYSTTSSSKAKSAKPPSPPNPLDSSPFTFPDLENFDPTYGLRPEGLPAKSTFRGFGNLFRPTRGLADLAEDEEEDEEEEDYEEDDDDGGASFDIVNWEYTVPPSLSIDEDNPRRTATPPQSEYETIPAVGGGTITRPRVFHSQSMLQSPIASPGRNSPAPLGKRRPSHISSLSGYSTPGGFFSNYSAGLHNAFHPPTDYFDPHHGQSHQPPPSLQSAPVFSNQRRNYTPDSEDTQQSGSTGFGVLSTSTPPTEPPFYDDEDDRFSYAHSTTRSPPRNMRPTSATIHRQPYLGIAQSQPSRPPTNAPSSRRASISAASATSSSAVDVDGFPMSSSPPAHHLLPHHPSSHSASASGSGTNPKIVLRPSLNNNSLSHLTTLSHSNHTLSPYTRAPQHFTVRSVPPSARAVPHHPSQGPVKAKRKRIFRLGGNNDKGKAKEDTDSARWPQKADETDFDESDMDQYFRTNEEANQEYEASDVFASPSAPPHLPLSPSIPGPIPLPNGDTGSLSSRSVSSQVRAALLQHRQQEQMYLHQRHPYRNQQLYPT